MKKSADKRALAPVDVAQRYTIAEATCYLRISNASIYKEINARRLRVLKLGRRTFVPGSEIARVSRLAGTPDEPREAVAPAKSAVGETTSYRLLDSRIHQALMKDIARQQTLWDAIQKFDAKLQHLLTLVERLALEASRRETRVAEVSTPAQFLRIKEVTARIGLRTTTIYRYIALGAFPRPRKVGHASLWVTAEVNDWIAKRTAGVPIELDNVSSSVLG